MSTFTRALLVALLSLVFTSATLAQISDDSIYLGKGGRSVYEVTSALTFSESIDPITFSTIYEVGGIVTIKDKLLKAEIDCVVDATYDPIDPGNIGKCTYKDSKGKKRKFDVAVDYETSSRRVFFIIKIKGKSVTINMKKYSSPDISGTWDFVNDPAGDMKIVGNSTFNKYVGTYSGTGAHSKLRGTLQGSVKTTKAGVTTWKGTFVIKELAVKINGNFVCTYNYDKPTTMDCQFSGGSGAAFKLQEK